MKDIIFVLSLDGYFYKFNRISLDNWIRLDMLDESQLIKISNRQGHDIYMYNKGSPWLERGKIKYQLI